MADDQQQPEPSGDRALVERVTIIESAMTSNASSDVRSVQDRLAALEKEFTKFKDSSEKSKETSKITENTLPKSVTCTVRKVAWSDFKNRCDEDDGRDAIEVLYIGADFSDEIRREHQRRRQTIARSSKRIMKQLTEQDMNRRRMYRIRIQSRAVLALLAQHLLQSWDEEIRTFVRPFKALLVVHEKMRNSLAELEAKWGEQERTETEKEKGAIATTTTTSEILSNGTGTQNVDLKQANSIILNVDDLQKAQSPEDSVTALREMRCYVQFMDREVVPIQSRFLNKTEDAVPKVLWEDLWCLFKPGEYVYTPVDPDKNKHNNLHPGQAQAPEQGPTPGWQTVRTVLAAVGPKMRLKTPGRRIKRKKKKSSDSSDGATDSEDDGEYSEQCFVCDSDPEPNNYAINIWCYHIDYDGHAFRPVFSNMLIDYYHGERDVDSLLVYPLRFAREERHILEQLTTRGDAFKRHINAPRCYYTGRSLEDKDARHYDGEVIIDFEEALSNRTDLTPDWLPHSPMRPDFSVTQDDFPIRLWTVVDGKKCFVEVSELLQKDFGAGILAWNNSLKEDKFLVAWQAWAKPGIEGSPPPLSSVDPVLLPQRILGYILKERKFIQMDVNGLHPMQRRLEAFNHLDIDARNKRLVKSLVHSHFERKRVEKLQGGKLMSQDIIQGKANNLIILLHGVPGVGKTATAEAIALANDKPLFPITCGDLGTDATTVETKLGTMFQLASRWNAVLLLDEADVFLAARRNQDLERNALVSVFLRILEYYSGILILTTNRVGAMDEAFQSRIHCMLYYPPLTANQTATIFSMNIDRLEQMERQWELVADQPAMQFNKQEIMDFAREHFHRDKLGRWNGRQIRNAFQIASSMARQEWLAENTNGSSEVPPVLKVAQFERVATATTEFRDYLMAAKGKHDSDLAQEHSERADDFDPRRSHLGYGSRNHLQYPDRYFPTSDRQHGWPYRDQGPPYNEYGHENRRHDRSRSQYSSHENDRHGTRGAKTSHVDRDRDRPADLKRNSSPDHSEGDRRYTRRRKGQSGEYNDRGGGKSGYRYDD